MSNIPTLNWHTATRRPACRSCLSNKGYGFLWHNPAIGRANFGKNLMEWQADVTGQMDYWICAGDTPRQIESQYADAVGHAPDNAGIRPGLLAVQAALLRTQERAASRGARIPQARGIRRWT